MALQQQTAPIGASMVHLFGVAPGQQAHEHSPATVATTTTSSIPHRQLSSFSKPAIPCILLPDDDEQIHSKRILLQGPPKSGRTSMAMNLAYACAAESAAPCHCSLQPCRCTSVILYRKSQAAPSTDRMRSNSAKEDFPLPCRFVGNATEVTSDTAAGNTTTTNHSIHAPHHHASKKSATTTLEEGNRTQDDWDPQILGRIRIQYVASAREMLQDLLGVLAKPLHDHPSRAIIVDDLDEIVACPTTTTTTTTSSSTTTSTSMAPTVGGMQHNSKSVHTETTISIMQTLAVAVDTSHALERLHGVLPFLVATMSSSTKISAPWMDTVVSLTMCSSTHSSDVVLVDARNQGSRSQAGGTLGRWRADFRGKGSGTGSSSWSSIVDYSFVQHSDDGNIIEWDQRS